MSGTLTGLFIYPVKSARGIALTEATLSERGLCDDRRSWSSMNRAASSRSARCRRWRGSRRRWRETRWRCRARASAGACRARRAPARRGASRCSPITWTRSKCPGRAPSFSQAIGRPALLVYMPEASLRQVDPKRANPGDVVSFADGFPYLLANESSLEALNRELAQPVPMARFRPNLVIAGPPAFAEDEFGALTIGEVPFQALKPSSRCVIINTDQISGAREPGTLEGLLRTHALGNRPVFGQNLVARGAGTVRVGDAVVW